MHCNQLNPYFTLILQTFNLRKTINVGYTWQIYKNYAEIPTVWGFFCLLLKHYKDVMIHMKHLLNCFMRKKFMRLGVCELKSPWNSIQQDMWSLTICYTILLWGSRTKENQASPMDDFIARIKCKRESIVTLVLKNVLTCNSNGGREGSLHTKVKSAF